MATIVEKPFELDLSLLQSGLATDLTAEPRSPGLHQSDIIRDLENAIVKPGERMADADISDDERATLNRYRELGFAWELILETAFKHRQIAGLDGSKFIKQPEILHDGVFKTADAIYIPDWRVMEYKLTFRSMSRASVDRIESEMWAWFVQLKGNCLGHSTRLASLFMFFVNGNYHPPVPQTKRYDIIFEDQELLDNWKMLKNHEVVMRREGRIK